MGQECELETRHEKSMKRRVILVVWVVMLVVVVAGELAPGTSALMRGVGWLQLSDKTLHFSAYLGLAALPLLGMRDRRSGLVAAAGVFLLGLVLEEAQRLSPGRSVEAGDVVANGLGVLAGMALVLPWRAWCKAK
jgi:hypothetical protein